MGVADSEEGVYALRFEPPHLLCVALLGDLTVDPIGRLFDRFDALVGHEPFWLLEVDMEALRSADSRTRRLAAERIARLPPYSLAAHGGGFGQRALAKLFFTATEILFRDRINRHKICDDQPQARAWLATEEERLRGLVTARR